MAPRGRRKAKASNDAGQVPDVYHDMLSEAFASPGRSDVEGRSVKKRRVGGQIVRQGSPIVNVKEESGLNDDHLYDDLFEDVAQATEQQIMRSESEDSADSDIDWENVDLKHEADDPIQVAGNQNPEQLDIVLDGQHGRQPTRPRRKAAATAIEKKLRLEIHKMNICCLLAHVHIRNHWCNDHAVHSALQKRLNNKTVSYLNPERSLSQFQQSRSFMDGLDQASDIFRGSFRRDAKGMIRPQWREPDALAEPPTPSNAELPIEKQDFLEAAHSLHGSRDTGAQIFCAMLRAAGVDARLVCSLQPLQFRAVEKIETPQRQYTMIVPHVHSRQNTPESGLENSNVESPTPGRLDGLGSDANGGKARPSTRTQAYKLPPESKFPIFWVEAFNTAVQAWIPIDPLVTKTIHKRSKFEPPLGDPSNTLSYVVAFEADGSARDVTRRYAKAYNAKTRRERVESTQGGVRWWRKVLKLFRRPIIDDRDQVEDAELAKYEAQEPMPKNISDFKDHPYYALERHLRRHEVIHPKRQVGKVGASGRGHDNKTLEPIFRRSDVQHVLSAERWFRQGREVKAGEQALKIVTPMPRKQGRSLDLDEDADGEDRAGTPLFGYQQTELYRPLPVENGQVPRNQYGNLDVYVPTMIPSGGAHVQHPLASRAAKICGVDFVDAVTGFKFSGRQGSAVTNGVVVASHCVDAVREVIQGLEDERVILEMEKRADAALKMWRRFMVGLRVRERIEGYDVEGEDAEKEEQMQDTMDEHEAGGGFFPEGDTEAMKPTQPAFQVQEDGLEPSSAPQHELVHRTAVHIPVTYGPPLPSHETGRASTTRSLFSPTPSPDGNGSPASEAGGGFLLDDDDDGDGGGARVDDPVTEPGTHTRDLEPEHLTNQPLLPSLDSAPVPDHSAQHPVSENQPQSAQQQSSGPSDQPVRGSGGDLEDGTAGPHTASSFGGVHAPSLLEKEDREREERKGGGVDSGDEDDDEDDDNGSLLSQDPEEDEEMEDAWLDGEDGG